METDVTMAFIDSDIEMLERYLKVAEAELRRARAREASAYQKSLGARRKADRDLVEWDLRGIEERYDQFVRFQRYAFFVLAFLVFEARTKELCGYVRDGRQLSLTIQDIQGNLLEKLKTYLCRYAKQADEAWNLWKVLRDLQWVRNQIVHQGGVCTSECRSKLEARARSIPGVSFQSDLGGFEIELTPASCRYAVSAIRRFFDEAGRRAGFRGPPVGQRTKAVLRH